MDRPETIPRPRRLSRAEAKEHTRDRLLDAAAALFARKGFAGASLEEIAESAGYSVGAVYSNFAGKEQLFLELLAARRSKASARRATAFSAFVEEASSGNSEPFGALSRLFTTVA